MLVLQLIFVFHMRESHGVDYTCAEFGIHNKSMSEESLCSGCPPNFISCPDSRYQKCAEISSICKSCKADPELCSDPKSGDPDCGVGRIIVICDGVAKCVLRSDACCEKGDNFVWCNGKCMNIQTLNITDYYPLDTIDSIKTENGVIPKDRCVEFRCGKQNQRPYSVSYGAHPQSHCINRAQLCGNCIEDSSCGNPNCVLGYVPLGCNHDNVRLTSARCVNQTFVEDCVRDDILCGEKYGFRCVPKKKLETFCRDGVVVDEVTNTPNPSAVVYKGLSIGIPLTIAAVGTGVGIAGVVAAVPMIKAVLT